MKPTEQFLNWFAVSHVWQLAIEGIYTEADVGRGDLRWIVQKGRPEAV